MFFWKFWKLEYLPDGKTDSVTFSFYSKTYQKVRKLSIWLNQQKIQISWLGHEKFSFFRSEYSHLNYAFCYFFLFSFSSHMTSKLSKLISQSEKVKTKISKTEKTWWTTPPKHTRRRKEAPTSRKNPQARVFIYCTLIGQWTNPTENEFLNHFQ